MSTIITSVLILPWLLFDLYFLLMNIILFIKMNRPLQRSAHLAPVFDDPLAVILIPVYNNSKTVLNVLIPNIIRMLTEKGKLPMRIAIVDSSTDGTSELIRKALDIAWTEESTERRVAKKQNLQLIHLKNRQGGKGWAINAVVQTINAKYFCILDSDWELSFEEFGKAIHYLEKNDHFSYAQIAWRASDRKLGFISGLDQVSIEYRHQFENRIRSWKKVPVTIHGTAVVIRTNAFLSAGGFDDTVLSEDVDLAIRLMLKGTPGECLSDLSMQENPCDHFKQFFLQKARWAEGRSQMLRKYAVSILKSQRMTIFSKLMWLYYLSYFGRCVGFALLLSLTVVGTLFNRPQLVMASAAWICICIILRWISNLVTMAQRVNRIPLICRFIEPFSFYGIGLIYTYTFFSGLFKKEGTWHVVECKNIA